MTDTPIDPTFRPPGTPPTSSRPHPSTRAETEFLTVAHPPQSEDVSFAHDGGDQSRLSHLSHAASQALNSLSRPFTELEGQAALHGASAGDGASLPRDASLADRPLSTQPRQDALGSNQPSETTGPGNNAPAPASNPASNVEGKQEAAKAAETQQAAASAAQAKTGEAPVKDQQRLESLSKLEQKAAEAHALEGEIGGLEEDMATLSSRLDDLRQRPHTPALQREMRALEGRLEEQRDALTRKQAQLEDVRRQMRAAGVDAQGWQGIEKTRVDRLRAQAEMTRQTERLDKNLRYVDEASDETAADLTESHEGSALSDDVAALQHVIRSKVRTGLANSYPDPRSATDHD